MNRSLDETINRSIDEPINREHLDEIDSAVESVPVVTDALPVPATPEDVPAVGASGSEFQNFLRSLGPGLEDEYTPSFAADVPALDDEDDDVIVDVGGFTTAEDDQAFVTDTYIRGAKHTGVVMPWETPLMSQIFGESTAKPSVSMPLIWTDSVPPRENADCVEPGPKIPAAQCPPVEQVDLEDGWAEVKHETDTAQMVNTEGEAVIEIFSDTDSSESESDSEAGSTDVEEVLDEPEEQHEADHSAAYFCAQVRNLKTRVVHECNERFAEDFKDILDFKTDVIGCQTRCGRLVDSRYELVQSESSWTDRCRVCYKGRRDCRLSFT
eukprot:Skav210666  [mRNA]  locus=scaffold4862:5744:9377:- [translate_table: standard]